MRVVIAGGGRVGAALAERLIGEKHSVTVIDRDRAVCEQLFEEHGATTIWGDATTASILATAGIASADIAAGVLARDADNLAFASLTRTASGARVMVRMLDASYAEAYRLAGVHDVVPEAEIVVSRMATEIAFPEVAGSMPLADGKAILFELEIAPRSIVAGKTVAQVRAEPGFPRECVFIGIVQADGTIELPQGSSVLRAGVTAIIVVARDELSQAVAFLGAEVERGGDSIAAVAEVLRGADFLAPLSDDELSDLSRGIELVRRGPGELIYKRGEAGDTFYLILSGGVELVAEGGTTIEVLGRGQFFGEVELLTGEARAFTAQSREESELAAIGRDDFHRVVMSNPAVALGMSRLLGQRLAETTRNQGRRRKKRGFLGLR